MDLRRRFWPDLPFQPQEELLEHRDLWSRSREPGYTHVLIRWEKQNGRETSECGCEPFKKRQPRLLIKCGPVTRSSLSPPPYWREKWGECMGAPRLLGELAMSAAQWEAVPAPQPNPQLTVSQAGMRRRSPCFVIETLTGVKDEMRISLAFPFITNTKVGVLPVQASSCPWVPRSRETRAWFVLILSEAHWKFSGRNLGLKRLGVNECLDLTSQPLNPTRFTLEKGRSHTQPKRSWWKLLPWEWSSWEKRGAGEGSRSSVSPKLCDSLCSCWHFSRYFTADLGADAPVSSVKLMMFFSAASSCILPGTCVLMPWKKKSHFFFGNWKGCQQLQNAAVLLSQAKLCLKETLWYSVCRWGLWVLGTALGFSAWWHVRVTHCFWNGHVLASKPCQEFWKKSGLLLWKVLNSQLATFQ